jgi:hypothetical protein
MRQMGQGTADSDLLCILLLEINVPGRCASGQRFLMEMVTQFRKKEGPVFRSFFFSKLAGSTRLELAASGVTGRRYNQLNYDPVVYGTW